MRIMETKKRSHKKYALILFSAILTAALIINLSLSYLVANKDRDNVFALGNVRLTLIEDAFPENQEERIMFPKSIVPKNPKIINNGSTDEYVFLRVVVPLCEVQLVDETTNKPDAKGRVYREIFNLLCSDAADSVNVDTSEFTVTDIGRFECHNKWKLLSAEEDTDAYTHTYIFGYSSLLTADNSFNETVTLFDMIQMRNVLEGELPSDAAQSVVVSAYGIQSEQLLNNVTVANPDNVTISELNNIFSLYKKQEGLR